MLNIIWKNLVRDVAAPSCILDTIDLLYARSCEIVSFTLFTYLGRYVLGTNKIINNLN